MKLQKLTIHNIASIEDAVIDFEAKPLSSSEVFLITGKTGAGKSTILDSICLALFATTPRLENTNMQGDLPDGEVDVKIDDPRQLMRKNTSEAFVQLTFVGNNGVHYEATWSVKRARNKVDGKIQSKSWQLMNLDTKYTLTKDKEISAEINNAVGLDFKQFCRTTMLAQGEFTRFLNSEDKDKADILEKITGVDVYSKIGVKIYNVTNEKKRVWEEQKHRVEETHTLSKEEIEEKENQLKTLDSQYEEAKAMKNSDAEKYAWLKTEKELSGAVVSAENNLKNANDVINSDDFKAKETLVKEWNATIDARNWMREADEAKRSREKHSREIETLKNEFSGLLGGFNYLVHEENKIKEKHKSVKSFIDSEKSKSSVYDNEQTIVTHLKTIDAGRKNIEEIRAVIDQDTKSLNDLLIPAHTKAENDVKLSAESVDTQASELKSKEDEVNALNLPDLRDKFNDASTLLNNIKFAKEKIEDLTAAKTQHEKVGFDLAKQFDEIGKKTSESQNLEMPIAEAKGKMDAFKETLDKQRDTIDKFAQNMRASLRIGDTCPVCGQRIEKELPHEEFFAELVAKSQSDYDEAKKIYEELAETRINLDAQIKAETDSYNKSKHSFDNDTTVSTAQKKAEEACKSCGILSLDDSTLSSLDKLESQTNEKKESLGSEIKEGEAKERALNELRTSLEAKRRELDVHREKVRRAENAENDCRGKIKNNETLVESKKQDVDSAIGKVAALITVDDWSSDWKDNPVSFAKELTEAAKKYNDFVKDDQRLETKIRESEQERGHISVVIDSVRKSMPEWMNLDAGLEHNVSDLHHKFNEVDNAVVSTLSNLKNADKRYVDNKQQLDTFLTKNELTNEITSLSAYSSDDITRETKSLENARMNAKEKNALHEDAKKRYEEHKAKQPKIAEEETVDVLNERISGYDTRLRIIGEQKGSIKTELEIDSKIQKELGDLKVDTEIKRQEYLKWEKMNSLLGDSTGSKFRKIAQSYVLASLIHSANYYMNTLTDRYTLDVKPGSFVITIRDAYQGFVSRAASTISGGEGFLVSLSLALALSDIGQKMSVDTLFIDEGFGTLSGEPLQNAINTLRTLHTKEGRHVGIISHVEELQERIPVQIQVHQENNNSCSRVTIVSK